MFDGIRDKVALVTGAGGGVGLEVVCLLHAQGAHVVGLDLKSAPSELPYGCSYVRENVTDPGVPEAAVARCTGDYGGVDFLVNAAGVAWFDRDGSVVDMADALWEQVLAINLTAPMRFARAAAAELRRRRGAMVHIASVAGLRGMDDPLDAYQVSKAALVSLSRGLAIGLAPEVRSNTICPGAIESPMTADIYADPSRREQMARRTPLARLGRPGDVAAACVYLLSEQASFVTGTDLVVDGGWLAVMP
jgi:NAD(P)-dependent dehydrogenase (short-subunit alcohol dehydrogenase family)